MRSKWGHRRPLGFSSGADSSCFPQPQLAAILLYCSAQRRQTAVITDYTAITWQVLTLAIHRSHGIIAIR